MTSCFWERVGTVGMCCRVEELCKQLRLIEEMVKNVSWNIFDKGNTFTAIASLLISNRYAMKRSKETCYFFEWSFIYLKKTKNILHKLKKYTIKGPINKNKMAKVLRLHEEKNVITEIEWIKTLTYITNFKVLRRSWWLKNHFAWQVKNKFNFPKWGHRRMLWSTSSEIHIYLG